MKRLPLSVLIVVVSAAVTVILYRALAKPAPRAAPETPFPETSVAEPRSGPADAPPASAPGPSDSLPKVTMTAVEYNVDRSAVNREREDPPFECKGGAGTGRVVDREGRVLLDSSAEIGIFGAVVGPDNRKVLVKGGSSANIVLEPSTGRKIRLPSSPPGVGMLRLDGWHWIGSGELFASSGVQAFDDKGEPVTGANGVTRTVFYTFDLTTERLFEVVMPAAVTQPVVVAADVMSDGHVHLVHDEPRKGVNQDLGWFRIDAMK